MRIPDKSNFNHQIMHALNLRKQLKNLTRKSLIIELIARWLTHTSKKMPRPDDASLGGLLDERFSTRWMDNALFSHTETRLCSYLQKKHGNTVASGLFKGMRFNAEEREFQSSMRLGTFELQVQHMLSSASGTEYSRILNIGCAEGYYAVGCAMLFENTPVLAMDIKSEMLEATLKLAELNHVRKSITTGERFDFANVSAGEVANNLILVDIEGFESELLLNPAAYAEADLIVEIHEGFHPGLTEKLCGAFRDSHQISVRTASDFRDMIVDVADLSAFSGLEAGILLFGNRGVETKWGFFKSKRRE